tara:strand:+ start:87 stop:884 length:798 start_codon:yes stop_codon:yes gene_type:complete
MDLNADKREAARQEKANKDAAFAAAETGYYGKEVQAKISQSSNVVGYTKDTSDAYATAVSTIGKGRAAIEDATKAFLSSQKVDEGGRSKKFGRNSYLTLLQKTNEVESVVDTILGRNMAYVQEGARRKFSLANAETREALGLIPQYGAPVMMPPTNRLGGALKIGTSLLSTAGSMYSLGAFGNPNVVNGPLSWIKSDRRLKDNIKEVGMSPKGYKIYEFSYKGDSTRYRGAMAQDVVKKNPMAVGIENNYLTVDYSQVDVDMEVV